MRFANLFGAAVVAVIAIGFTAPASAQDTVLLTIDLPRAQSETDLGADIMRQVTELEEQFRDNLQAGGQELQGEIEELQRQRTEFIITDEVYEQRLAELQQRDQQLRARFEISSQAVQYARSRAAELYFEAILPDVEAIMTERNGTALAERRTMILSSDEMDITEEVVRRVNARITELEVQLLPQRQPAAEE